MAYRRKQGGTVMGRSLTFKEELYPRSTTSSSLAARAIMASAAHRESSLSQGITSRYDHGYTSMGSSNEGAGSYWGVLARKAITILKDDNQPTIGNTLEEGGSIVDTQNSADFIEETRKIQIRRKGMMNDETWQHSANQTSQEDQIKASRDVAMATAAKAKLLLRELRTVKADLAFAKERCSQLEEENKSHRESREKGVNIAADDDMIRLQLETLLAEKARLAHENSVYARENRFLREIVEYHQLTMQDVLYLNEGFEDGTEDDQVYSSMSPPRSPTTISRISSSSSLSRTSSLNKEMQLPKTTPTSAAIPVPSPH